MLTGNGFRDRLLASVKVLQTRADPVGAVDRDLITDIDIAVGMVIRIGIDVYGVVISGSFKYPDIEIFLLTCRRRSQDKSRLTFTDTGDRLIYFGVSGFGRFSLA